MAADEVTQLLISARSGDQGALNALLPLVYRELHTVASRALSGGRPDDTLNTTALVHEAFLKLHGREPLSIQDRRHFFAVAAMAMRQIIVDRARMRMAEKRGGGAHRVNLDDIQIAVDACAGEILALEEALTRLASLNERLARVVELRFYAGLTVEETADVLGIDSSTVKRDWRKARAILYLTLGGGAGPWPITRPT